MTDVPNTWEIVEIDEVIDVQSDGRKIHQGWSPQCHKEPRASIEEWAVLKTTAIQAGQFCPEHHKRLPECLSPRPGIEVSVGDLLITCAGPRVRCGVACLVRATEPRLLMSGKMYRFRAIPGATDPRYLEAFLQTEEAQLAIDQMKTGGSESGLNLTHDRFKRLQVRIAPFAEQVRIVEKVDELLSDLDAGVAELKAAQRKLAQYRKSLLMAAVEGALTTDWRATHGTPRETGAELLQRILAERRARWEQKQLAKFAQQGKTPPIGWQAKYPEPVDPELTDLPALPPGWVWATYEQVSTRVTVGHVGPMKQHYVASGVPFLRSQNVRENRFSPEGLLFIKREFHDELSKSKLRPGDIVVVRSGSVGVSCVIPDVLNEANCSDLVLIQEPHGIIPSFGAYFLNSAAKGDVRRGQSGIALTHFNTQAVAALRISVPPIGEQKKIVEIVEENLAAMEQLGIELANKLRMAAAQRKNILKAAFAGQLVPQDPGDETASELLARIRAERASNDRSAPRRRRKTA